MLDGMVRREGPGSAPAIAGVAPGPRCASPTGESPVQVSAGAPGSRSQPSGRDSDGRAGRRKPVRRRKPRSREQQRGPQHEVKPAASTEKQSASRAAHFTAKATSSKPAPECFDNRGGVGGAARVEGGVRNSGGPSASLMSEQGASYKPKGAALFRHHFTRRSRGGRFGRMCASGSGTSPSYRDAWRRRYSASR